MLKSVSLCAVCFSCVFTVQHTAILYLCYLLANLSVLGFQRVDKQNDVFVSKCKELCVCLCEQVFTWVNVKLALHCFGNALQFDGLQGALSVDGGGQAAQRLPDEAGHFPHCEDLQQLAINRWERPQEHRLEKTRQRSINCTATMNPLSSKFAIFSSQTEIT